MTDAAIRLVERYRARWSKLPKGDASRLLGFADNMLGKTKARMEDGRQMPGKPTVYWFPGLDTKPWYDVKDYPWVAELEKNAEVIAEEFRALHGGAGVSRVQETSRPDLKPADWQQLLLRRYEDAAWTDEAVGGSDAVTETNRKNAPRTAAILDRLPIMGNASFSVLGEGGRIADHCSDFNAKVVCQMGLVIPKSCSITVAGDTRGWKPGKCLVFDDTFPHSVINDGPGMRVVLLMEAWHHDLTPLELAEMKALMDEGAKLGSALPADAKKGQKMGGKMGGKAGKMDRDQSRYFPPR